MGGYGSGRDADHAVVESGFTLDINWFLRERGIVPGARRSGVLRWYYRETGKQKGSISYESCVHDIEDAWVRLWYSVNDQPQSYRVRLVTTPCHFGGRRWWWTCPMSGRRVAKLHLPAGARIFAARQTYRLAYESQRKTLVDRSHDRQSRLYRRLEGEYRCFGDPPPPRPKGMHHKTYERLIVELYEAMELHDRIFALDAEKLLARLRKSDARRSSRR